MSDHLNAPELVPEPGWEDLRSEKWPKRGGPSFVSGDEFGNRYRVRYYRRRGDQMLVGKAWFGPGTQGPPGHAHGGSMAALLDEVMGTAGWIAGHPVVAANISIDFRSMLPLGRIVWFEGWVDRVEGRKVYTRAKLFDPETDALYAEGAGLFIIMRNEMLQEVARRAKEQLERPPDQGPGIA